MKKFMFAAIAAMVMVSVSNVFASSKMVSNSEVAPVDTVAPETPADTLATGTPIQPQAGVEDSTKTEENTQTTEEPAKVEENTQTTEEPAKVQETPQEETTQQEATEQQATEQQTTAE
jgi:outer membrane biosynthesis protein TonB